MIDKIVIEWTYEPKDYFEEKIVFSESYYNMSIDNGAAKAIIDPTFFDQTAELTDELTHELESRFLAVQVMTHQPYKLSKPSRYDLRKDGTQNIYLQVDSIVCKSSVGSVDLIIRDNEGNIISDTKQERIDKKKWVAETAQKYRDVDETLNQMLNSYSASVTDPKNEFVHLYEIRDALTVRFGNKSRAKSELSITNNEWSTLGRIANDEPLSQGRHRGQSAGKLRNAEQSELDEARKIASKIVENYMKFLECNKGE